ncbi:gephyrin-like molybdotransferase Glp [Algibacter miyuki]|uniref:Molybdopterin molybdenumtransferase n=1 Tax=Algibacter miyuki TaxID=1306933 RepID=A0ABV5H299_9FLAO|nr:gephyrin-like molybdotransferase Glp [Algibacter miyuki]MDN3667350.1 molybdopterin molybdotransferase MoeA [Algibacter miyuki]
MISIAQAINAVKQHAKPLFKKTVKTAEKAGGYLLFEDVHSPINMPPFRQSAMDGYALNLHDDFTYKLIGEVQAGDDRQPVLKPGEAIRIFTGAAVPATANAVIMQEQVTAEKKQIRINKEVNENQNIRPLGEQVKQHELALKAGTKLTPAAIGYLSSLGITTVTVYKKPSIAIVSTGNELIEPGNDLSYGQIYESNSKMLLSALYSLKFYDVTIHNVTDNYGKTLAKLKSVISENNLVIITGGISVGDYDYVGKALNELHVEEIFYKVKQKPGKPLFFGKKQDTQIFALPGNPAAALTCFYVYVYIALQGLMNREDLELPRVKGQSISNFIKRGDRPQFLKAIYTNGKVEILEGQSSAMQQTFALSNALVFMDENDTEVTINDALETILLPV